MKLDSQDHLQIGDKEFYFLLPVRSILGGAIGSRHQVGYPTGAGRLPRQVEGDVVKGDALVVAGSAGKKPKRDLQSDKKGEGRAKFDREADNRQLLLAEEKDVVSSVATVLSDLCGPGEWMPMEKLHSELVEIYANVWHHTRVRRYLTSEEYPSAESQGKPWYGLLMLLRKYPEHFVINTRSTGRIKSEFVSLVSLVS